MFPLDECLVSEERKMSEWSEGFAAIGEVWAARARLSHAYCCYRSRYGCFHTGMGNVVPLYFCTKGYTFRPGGCKKNDNVRYRWKDNHDAVLINIYRSRLLLLSLMNCETQQKQKSYEGDLDFHSCTTRKINNNNHLNRTKNRSSTCQLWCKLN